MASTADLEAQKASERLLLEWENVTYAVKNKKILTDVSGRVEAGEMLAIMGPSGAGKSTILDVISRRNAPTAGSVTVNGDPAADMSALAAYVEQSDALLGVLTVHETIRFAARLSLDPATPADEIRARVAAVISDLGLTDAANTRIGNAVQRGVSGGQKRRTTLGAALVTRPRILLLDEPTSGLDSRTSREVLSAIKTVAQKHNIAVVASIHQPNWETFSLFDRLLVLARGKTMFFGPTNRLDAYLADGLGHPVPKYANPADHALDVFNTDFLSDSAQRETHVDELAARWREYATANGLARHETDKDEHETMAGSVVRMSTAHLSTQRKGIRAAVTRALYRTGILMERNMINYSRNLLAYGVRLGMYVGMGVMLATIWVNLAQTSSKLNDRLSVHFFSVAFLGFMSVAGIPAFLEERQVFARERRDGLYGPGAYVLASSLVSLPYLFACVLLFAVISYWSIGLHPGAGPFFRFVGILFLAVYTAEAQSAVVAAALPIFVAALAIASFLNGFWMSVGGYFIRAVDLPRFWYYWAHFIDYQTYAFDLLVANDLRGLTFACARGADGACFCDFPSSLVAQGECAVAGEDVLQTLGISGISFALYAVILLLISLIYRVLLYLMLVLRKR